MWYPATPASDSEAQFLGETGRFFRLSRQIESFRKIVPRDMMARLLHSWRE
jgi:hypothetical protein